MSPEGRCGNCRASLRALFFDGTVRVGPYLDQMQELLQQFKFCRADHLELYLADLMSRSFNLAPWRERIEAIVPIPTNWLRRLSVGFYSPDVLARRVAKTNRLPYLPLLTRTRFDPHQIGLSVSARHENVKGAFKIKSHVKIAGARLCVVDDVMTSGATVNEVSKVLKQAGAVEVWILVLARAGRHNIAQQNA